MKGISVVSGKAIASPLILNEVKFQDFKHKKTNNVELELDRLNRSKEKTKSFLQGLLCRGEHVFSKEALEIVNIHLDLLDDPELIDETIEIIENSHLCAEAALLDNEERICTEFAEVNDPYIRERISDIHDVIKRLLYALANIEFEDLFFLEQDVILVAEELEPSQLVSANIKHIKGIICEKGGKTSHLAIIARSLSIPTIFGVDQAVNKLENAINVYVNGTDGYIEINKTASEVNTIKQDIAETERIKISLLQYSSKKGITREGYQIPVRANIGSVDEAKKAKEAGAEGIGLFRTEFMFMENSIMPSEEEQCAIYQEVLQLFPNDIVTIRTFDAGGDKQIPYLDFSTEMNPFLGCRAIRYCLRHKTLFKVQLRALLRASCYGNLRILFPMISSIEELRIVKELLEESKSELREEGHLYSENIECGIMIEVPSAALCADELAQETDFFSIGSNDLTQYTLAVDRNNEDIHDMFTEFHPAVLKLIKMTILKAHKHGKHVCLCGEFGGNLLATRLLLALGIDELSMNQSAMNRIKKILAETEKEKIEEYYFQVLQNSKEAQTIEEQARNDLVNENLSYMLNL